MSGATRYRTLDKGHAGNMTASKNQSPDSILVVDDDAACRSMYRDMLEATGYRVAEAECSESASAMLAAIDVDLLLVDESTPRFNGNDLISEIRRDCRHGLTPIIVVNGSVDSKAIENSLEAGASDYLRQPFDEAELLARVRAALKHKHVVDQLDNAEAVLFAMARMIEAKDSYTAQHCARLIKTCRVFGQALALSDADMDALLKGAVLHDVGKIGVPDSILLKQGPLDAAEWTVMRRHPQIGAQLCAGLNSIGEAVPIILHHHERWDGSGYPGGLRGEAIPYLARTFQIADIFDALRHRRPYGVELPLAEVIQTLRQETDRGWRDPVLVGVFLDLLRDRPDDFALQADDPLGPGAELFDRIFRPQQAGLSG